MNGHSQGLEKVSPTLAKYASAASLIPSVSAHSVARLLGRRVISKGRGSTRRRRNIQLLWRRQSRRIHTAAAAMYGKGAVATTATNTKASHRQLHPQLLLITEQPSEGREFPTGPQWEDSSLNIKSPPSAQYFCLITLKYTPVYRYQR